MIAIIGAGGTGSHIAHKLAMHCAAENALGRKPLEIHIYDPKPIRYANMYRQVHLTKDISTNKALALASNITQAYNGIIVLGYPIPMLKKKFNELGYDYIFLAVDQHEFRLDLELSNSVLIDCGNNQDYGQVITTIFNQEGAFGPVYGDYRFQPPETEAGDSCTLSESLSRQSLFINAFIADLAVMHFIKVSQDPKPMQSFLNLETLEVKTSFKTKL